MGRDRRLDKHLFHMTTQVFLGAILLDGASTRNLSMVWYPAPKKILDSGNVIVLTNILHLGHGSSGVDVLLYMYSNTLDHRTNIIYWL
jgi:hypothetical protein